MAPGPHSLSPSPARGGGTRGATAERPLVEEAAQARIYERYELNLNRLLGVAGRRLKPCG